MEKTECKKTYFGQRDMAYRLLGPVLLMGGPLVIHCFNPCITNDQTFFRVLTGVYGGCVGLVALTTWLSLGESYCDKEHLCRHNYLYAVLLCSVGATIGSYDFYTYNLNIFAVLWSLCMWVVAGWMMVANFCKGHVHDCPSNESADGDQIPLKCTKDPEVVADNCKAVSIILFILAWLTIPGFVAVYDSSLYTNRDPQACWVN